MFRNGSVNAILEALDFCPIDKMKGDYTIIIKHLKVGNS